MMEKGFTADPRLSQNLGQKLAAPQQQQNITAAGKAAGALEELLLNTIYIIHPTDSSIFSDVSHSDPTRTLIWSKLQA